MLHGPFLCVLKNCQGSEADGPDHLQLQELRCRLFWRTYDVSSTYLLLELQGIPGYLCAVRSLCGQEAEVWKYTVLLAVCLIILYL